MSDVTLTLSAEAAAKLEQLLGGSVPSANPADSTDARHSYEVYRARVTRGTPKTFEQWIATVKPTAITSRPAATDTQAAAVAAITRRSDCVAVLRVQGNLIGCYRFMRKSDNVDRFTMSGDADNETQRAIMGLLSTYVIATGPMVDGFTE